MLKREENEELFHAIMKSKYGADYALPNNELSQKTELSDEELASVTDLTMWTNSLAGIDKLVNLKKLVLHCENNMLYQKYKIEKTADGLKKANSIYQKGQIKDITPLYKCKKLEELKCDYQRNIKQIDLANWPDIRVVSMRVCSELLKVVGLEETNTFDKLLTDKKFAETCLFDFDGCEQLKFFGDLNSIVNYEGASYKVSSRPIIKLPLKTYLSMANNQKELIESYHEIFDNTQNDIIGWTENGYQKSLGVVHTAHQVKMLKERMDAILDTICDDTMNSLQQVYNVYDWITHNINYDMYTRNFIHTNYTPQGFAIFDALGNSPVAKYIKNNQSIVKCVDKVKKSKSYGKVSETLKQGEKSVKLHTGNIYKSVSTKLEYDPVGKIKERKKDLRYNTIAKAESGYIALFDKSAICGGISNLLDIFLANMGYRSDICLCASKDSRHKTFLDGINHQILKVSIKSPNSKTPCEYYCDPTWDLGKESPRFFLLSKGEIERTHVLNVNEYAVKNEASLQRNVKKCEEYLKEQRKKEDDQMFRHLQPISGAQVSQAQNIEQSSMTTQQSNSSSASLEEQMSR